MTKAWQNPLKTPTHTLAAREAVFELRSFIAQSEYQQEALHKPSRWDNMKKCEAIKSSMSSANFLLFARLTYPPRKARLDTYRPFKSTKGNKSRFNVGRITQCRYWSRKTNVSKRCLERYFGDVFQSLQVWLNIRTHPTKQSISATPSLSTTTTISQCLQKFISFAMPKANTT
jgi:hypothetical protein